MDWIFILCPGILSVCILEKVQQKHYSPFSFLKGYTLFTFFINFFSVLVYYYFINPETSIINNFIYNGFLVHYTILALLFSILLPILYLIFMPWFSVRLVSRKDTEKKTKNTEKKISSETE